MDETKHTPGPWTAHDDDGTGTLPCVLSEKVNAGGNFYVAQCNVFEDARLIAAAPELLEALEHLVPMTWNDGPLCEVYRESGKRAETAIAKARGAA